MVKTDTIFMPTVMNMSNFWQNICTSLRDIVEVSRPLETRLLNNRG